MLKEIKILSDHGRQYIKDLRKQPVSELFRGRPLISESIDQSEIMKVSQFCPAGAIDGDSGAIDLGKCVFCRECTFLLPEKISFTNDYRIATNTRESLVIRPGSKGAVKLDETKIRADIRKLFKNALKLRQVSAGGDNSCEMELNAAGNVNFDMSRYGIEFVASPRHADGIVITGPITENMAEALQICYDAVPEPKVVILAGTDAISGGIFRQSNALDRSFLNKCEIDLFVPGNPMHPLTFINGILDLIRGNV